MENIWVDLKSHTEREVDRELRDDTEDSDACPDSVNSQLNVCPPINKAGKTNQDKY